MFKKVVSAIMIAAMVGTMMAPVSVSAKDGGKTIELWTCWTEGADTEKASQEMIQKWEEETGNTVNQTNFTYDMLHEKILTAAAGGNEARSTSSRRVVFAIAPIKPAVAASRKGLLNITENPNTPKKLAINRKIRYWNLLRSRGRKSIGFK